MQRVSFGLSGKVGEIQENLREEGIEICPVTDGCVIEPGKVYLPYVPDARRNSDEWEHGILHDGHVAFLDNGSGLYFVLEGYEHIPNATHPIDIRPIDDTMTSAAGVFRERCYGVVLDGSGDDSKWGVTAIKHYGGRTFAQNLRTCEVGDMPDYAIRTGYVDHIQPVDEMARTIRTLLLE